MNVMLDLLRDSTNLIFLASLSGLRQGIVAVLLRWGYFTMRLVSGTHDGRVLPLERGLDQLEFLIPLLWLLSLSKQLHLSRIVRWWLKVGGRVRIWALTSHIFVCTLWKTCLVDERRLKKLCALFSPLMKPQLLCFDDFSILMVNSIFYWKTGLVRVARIRGRVWSWASLHVLQLWCVIRYRNLILVSHRDHAAFATVTTCCGTLRLSAMWFEPRAYWWRMLRASFGQMWLRTVSLFLILTIPLQLNLVPDVDEGGRVAVIDRFALDHFQTLLTLTITVSIDGVIDRQCYCSAFWSASQQLYAILRAWIIVW